MRSFLALGLALYAPLFIAADTTQQTPTSDKIRILPVKVTPESETSTVVVSLPQRNQLVAQDPVWLQVKVEGYPIGADSPFDRANEVGVSKIGQSVHVVIDNLPYFTISQPALDPFNEAGWYYETNYKAEIPAKLGEGEHSVRAFLARSFGESLKGSDTFFASTFYVGAKGNSKYDFSKAFLTYNEPSNQIYMTENTPVLLDFLISNCELSSDGYKVNLIVDRRAKRTLISWQPYYLYGLKAGDHKVRLQLLDPDGKVVPGPFNDVEHTITIHKN